MDIQYIGEHLLPGVLGHLLIILGFTAALFSAISYGFAVNPATPEIGKQWLKFGRIGFLTHGFSILAVIGLIFFIMLSRYYEYEYVQNHVSDDLPFKYTFSAFWQDQEGSFLLWMFWHIILGFVLMRIARAWEAPVISVIASVQVILVSMILGIYLNETGARIGSNPFVLLRETINAPIFGQADYLSKVTGNGINPLLQNYWMTIHPPTLFLGFAATIVPFAYVVAGLWKKDYTGWLKPAMHWSLFTGAILGIGIVMGGAWAYEALSFGGYWAWDPVENTSLVPWLVLVAGVHTAVIANNTGRSYRTTMVFFIMSFVLVLYSTLLTRSGVLGETSVHAFTEMGLEWQLIIFTATPFVLAFGLMALRWKNLPHLAKEESTYSKEFWMFIGALVLIFSAVLITATTSIPVYNKLFGLKLAPPSDPVAHYNKYQIWIAILLALLSGGAQYLRFKEQKTLGERLNKVLAKLGLWAFLSAFVTVGTVVLAGFSVWQYVILLWAATFTIFCNADYIFSVLKGNFKLAGSAVSHLGLGILFWGILFSAGKKEVLSVGRNAMTALDELNPQTNSSVVAPFGEYVRMKEYFNKDRQVEAYYEVAYLGDFNEGNEDFFTVNYRKKDGKGNTLDSFVVHPNSIRKIRPDGTKEFKASNPDTKHYITEDVFTIAVPDWAFMSPEEQSEKRAKEDTSSAWVPFKMAVGDTIHYKQYIIKFKEIERKPARDDYQPAEGDLAVGARLEVQDTKLNKSYDVMPILLIRGSNLFNIPDEIKANGLRLRYPNILTAEDKSLIEVYQGAAPFVVIQSLRFPGINLVWIGKLMLMSGFVMSLLYRLANKYKTAE